jgi:hypothetical protein
MDSSDKNDCAKLAAINALTVAAHAQSSLGPICNSTVIVFSDLGEHDVASLIYDGCPTGLATTGGPLR